MNALSLVGFALIAPLLLIVLTTCEEPEEEIVPVLAPPSPDVQRQAAAGEAAAQFAMAEYHLGDDDPAVMLRWLRSSACQGYPLAPVSLGVLYDVGDRLYQDRIEAYLWFSWAAQQGDPEAAGFAADLSVAMEDDERAFAQALARKGWAAMRDCMER